MASRGGRTEPLVLHCPHAPDAECRCRKPRPGMLVDAIARLRVHAGDCVLVGDHMHDLHAAESAGCWSVHVRSGRGGLPDDPRWDVSGACRISLMRPISRCPRGDDP